MDEAIPLTFVVNIIKRAELRPGDILVLSTEAFLTEAMIDQLKRQLQPALPAGVKVAICDGGIGIAGIVGAEYVSRETEKAL